LLHDNLYINSEWKVTLTRSLVTGFPEKVSIFDAGITEFEAAFSKTVYY